MTGKYRTHLRRAVCSALPALLFSFFLVMGRTFYEVGSWALVFGSQERLTRSAAFFTAYFLLLWGCIFLLYFLLRRHFASRKEHSSRFRWLRSYERQLLTHPFRTVFLTLLIAYIPYMILYYPGIMMNDSRVQLELAFGVFSGGRTMKNHHPVVHTLLLWFFTSFGNTFFGSANAGLFLCALTQSLLLFASIAWMAKALAERGASARSLELLLLFHICTARLRNYVFLLSKDTWFAPFFLLFVVQLYRLAEDRFATDSEKRKHMGLLLVSMAGVFFFRNDGVYNLMFTFAILALVQKGRRLRFLKLLVGTLLCYLLYTNVVLPAFSVKPGNPADMLSVPFQQTARYVRDAGSEVTEEEKEAIGKILDYENLAQLYNPNLSDPVKHSYNTDAASEDLKEYFAVWFQMLLKRPDIYVQATMNNVYGYFYPGGHTTDIYGWEGSEEDMERANESLAEYETDFHHPRALDESRMKAELFREELFQLPVFSVLNRSASFVWAFILLGFYCIQERKKHLQRALLPMLASLLICIAGPTYGWYFRYLYAFAVSIPGLILLGLLEKNDYAMIDL